MNNLKIDDTAHTYDSSSTSECNLKWESIDAAFGLARKLWRVLIRANSWRFLLIFGHEVHEFHEKDQKITSR